MRCATPKTLFLCHTHVIVEFAMHVCLRLEWETAEQLVQPKIYSGEIRDNGISAENGTAERIHTLVVTLWVY
jgi:hypothetical protein